MTEKFPMTPRGQAQLRAELKKIREVDRPENVAEIEEALSHGDLKENAEYHAAKERQAALAPRMTSPAYRLGLAVAIDPTKVSTDKVAFGATVTLLDMETDEEVTYALVGEDEADADEGRINIKSPIARAMMGKVEGDDVLVRLPKGDREFEVVSIEYKAIQ